MSWASPRLNMKHSFGVLLAGAAAALDEVAEKGRPGAEYRLVTVKL